jgi:hypothetical protein
MWLDLVDGNGLFSKYAKRPNKSLKPNRSPRLPNATRQVLFNSEKCIAEGGP